MAFKLDNCCLCIPLQIGVYMIGGLVCLSLLIEIELFNLYRTILESIVFLTFLLMVFKDSAATRQIFFVSYLFGWIGGTIIAKRSEGGYDLKEEAALACN